MEYGYATDDKALEAFMKLARLEGIIPALESSRRGECIVQAPKLGKDKVIIVNLSGRGDKDVAQARGQDRFADAKVKRHECGAYLTNIHSCVASIALF